MKYIYGPVKSRRLGLSLGISLTPYKTCNFDCLYCQLGSTAQKTNLRKEYVKTADIIKELESWVENNKQEAGGLNYITLSGSGEPTLNIKISEIIGSIKKIINCKVAVITNASLLSDAGVRREILGADLIVPSLDAVGEAVFKKIDRPHPDIKIEQVIKGLEDLRKEFRGLIWLEVMLVRGINDRPAQIRKLKEAILRINPDKIQLNSPVRTTAEKDILPVDSKKLEKIKEMLGDKAEIV